MEEHTDKKKEQHKKKKKTKASTLSFGEEEEEDNSTTFVVKKSKQSVEFRKNAKADGYRPKQPPSSYASSSGEYTAEKLAALASGCVIWSNTLPRLTAYLFELLAAMRSDPSFLNTLYTRTRMTSSTPFRGISGDPVAGVDFDVAEPPLQEPGGGFSPGDAGGAEAIPSADAILLAKRRREAARAGEDFIALDGRSQRQQSMQDPDDVDLSRACSPRRFHGNSPLSPESFSLPKP